MKQIIHIFIAVFKALDNTKHQPQIPLYQLLAGSFVLLMLVVLRAAKRAPEASAALAEQGAKR